jgi:hypothetical protein
MALFTQDELDLIFNRGFKPAPGYSPIVPAQATTQNYPNFITIEVATLTPAPIFDLGILGVIIFPFIYGFIVRKAIFTYNNMPNKLNLTVFVFLFITMLNSIFKWGLQSPASNIVIIICCLWSRKQKNIIKK